jgi:hypothetical protein
VLAEGCTNPSIKLVYMEGLPDQYEVPLLLELALVETQLVRLRPDVALVIAPIMEVDTLVFIERVAYCTDRIANSEHLMTRCVRRMRTEQVAPVLVALTKLHQHSVEPDPERRLRVD